LDLLAGSDIQFRREARLDVALVQNLPVALVFLPAADIPAFVGEGKIDIGITGRDQVAEHEAHSPPTETAGVQEVLDLGFGRCSLKVQVPENGPLRDPKELIGKNVVTSFTGLAKTYFAQLEGHLQDTREDGIDSIPERKIKTKIKFVSGSVEAACLLGLGDAIVDLVGMPDVIFDTILWLTTFRVWYDDESCWFD
jgi:ATP phosphoribosyltransferase